MRCHDAERYSAPDTSTGHDSSSSTQNRKLGIDLRLVAEALIEAATELTNGPQRYHNRVSRARVALHIAPRISRVLPTIDPDADEYMGLKLAQALEDRPEHSRKMAYASDRILCEIYSGLPKDA